MSDPVPSILDRLLGIGPASGATPSPRRRSTGRARRIERMLGLRDAGTRVARREPDAMAWMVAAIKEDLRLLLNQRRMVEGLESDDLLSRSRLAYGLDDLSHHSPDDLRRGERLRVMILEAIERFEPRLSAVRVDIEPGRPSDLDVRLSISATLTLDFESRPVNFGTILRLTTREIVVTGGIDGTEADRELSP
jgi:type VI secretion system lysozyme-like protein